MPYEQIYRLEWTNFHGHDCTIHISDTTSGDANPPTYHDMEAVKVLRKIVSDNESKTGVKGMRLEFSFIMTDVYNTNTFIGGSDNRWLVEAYVGTTRIFIGWLIVDALREPHLDIGIIEMTATDNLGVLRETPHTKADGTIPRDEFRLIDFIADAFKKTNLLLPIKVVHNLLPEGMGATENIFNDVFLGSKTFETDVYEMEDSFQVIEKLTPGCLVTQDGEVRWIIRIDEMNGNPYRVYNYDADGVLGSVETVTLIKSIGINEPIFLINKDAEILPERKKKYVKTKFNFTFPMEIVDNIDFSRGTTWVSPFVVDMSYFIRSYANLAAFPNPGEFDTTYKALDSGLYYKWVGTVYVNITGAEIPQGLGYIIEDWVLERASGSVSLSAYVIKIKQYGDEKTRYVQMTAGPSLHWIKSNRIPVGRFDKFIFSVDRRINFRATGSGQTTDFFAQIRLHGEDGTYWTITNYLFGSDQPGQWVPSNSTFTLNPRYIAAQYVRNQVDTSNWMSAAVNANPLPVNGELEILLLQHTVNGTAYLTHFSNLQFQYIPYINGTYEKFSAQTHKVSTTDNLKAKIEEEVFIADSPKKLFKGALLKQAGSQYTLTDLWYNFNAGTSGELGIAKFGKYQAFEMWNQNNRPIRKIPASLLGLDTATPGDMPGILHVYNFADPSDNTDNKNFILLSYSQDLKTCKWEGTFADVADDVDVKVYNSDHEFKYTSKNDE